jgi:hypothetical protein
MLQIHTLVGKAYDDKDNMVKRLNKIRASMQQKDTLIEKVRLKCQWLEERTLYITRIEKKIAYVEMLLCRENKKQAAIEREYRNFIDQQQLLKITLCTIKEGYAYETSYTP